MASAVYSGRVLLIYATNLEMSGILEIMGCLNDVGKVLITSALFMLVNHISNQHVSTSKVYQSAQKLSFFVYAGHFLFSSMIMQHIGKFTLLIFICNGLRLLDWKEIRTKANETIQCML